MVVISFSFLKYAITTTPITMELDEARVKVFLFKSRSSGVYTEIMLVQIFIQQNIVGVMKI